MGIEKYERNPEEVKAEEELSIEKESLEDEYKDLDKQKNEEVEQVAAELAPELAPDLYALKEDIKQNLEKNPESNEIADLNEKIDEDNMGFSHYDAETGEYIGGKDDDAQVEEYKTVV